MRNLKKTGVWQKRNTKHTQQHHEKAPNIYGQHNGRSWGQKIYKSRV